jgi:hypothetical protein
MKKRWLKALLLAMVVLLSLAVVGCGSNWPSNWPKDLPEFKYGHVTANAQNSMDKAMGSESVNLTQLEPNALAKYKADVKAAGWGIVSETNAYFSATKNGHMVTVLIGSTDGVNVGTIGYK